MRKASRMFVQAGLLGLVACTASPPHADLILHGARAYTLAWPDPDIEGRPAPAAPWNSASGWQHDASAVAIRDGRIVYVGSDSGALALRGDATEVVDLAGATLLPGMVDAHTHVAELGASLDRVDLTGIATVSEAIALVVERAARTPTGEWILGFGWDEGAWANDYPDKVQLSAAVPDHPVMLRGLHGFAAWLNAPALRAIGITAATPIPAGGEMRRDAAGDPSGLFLNRAVALIDSAVPLPTAVQRDSQLVRALRVMAAEGYTSIHEAGTPRDVLEALQRLDAADALPIRVYAMLDGRDPALVREWIARGPDVDGPLVVRSVKAYYDGALGSRGARLLEDYTDRPGHRGVSGAGYGFDHEVIADAMAAGFQVAVHAIGDAGNREVLAFLDSVVTAVPAAREQRHRIEHAQVVHPDDFTRFATLDVIASVQPPHAVEDMPWAAERIGPDRVRGAYAWRTFRRAGVPMVFSSDLPGSRWSLFYGLHSAMAREDMAGQPAGGWFPDQRMTPEEAVRGYTSWAAWAAFEEGDAGVIAPGMRADLTALSVDPLRLGSPAELLTGTVRLTVVGGRVVR